VAKKAPNAAVALSIGKTGPISEEEKMQALYNAGLDESALSTEPPAYIYPIGVAAVLISIYISYTIARSG
jgi:hypothetical protein